MSEHSIWNRITFGKTAGLLFWLCLVLLNQRALAQDKPELPKPEQPNPQGEGISKTVEEASNPLAFITKWQIQPNYSFREDDARQLILIDRVVQPTKSVILPFIKSKDPNKMYTIYRIEVPVVGQTFPDARKELNATGFADITLLDILAFKKSWGLFGVGPALMIPAASEKVLGTGKWSAGPDFLLVYTKIKNLQMGFLGEQFYSFAGDKDRPKQNHMIFQPIVSLTLHDGYFLQFAPIMRFNWERGIYTVPVNLLFGKALAKNITTNIGPDLVLSGPAKGDLTIRLNVILLFAPKGQVKSSLTF